MALQGNISDFGLADILQLIGLQKKTGILEIQKDADTAMIFFEEGQIIYANSSKKGDTEKIGQVLLKNGRILESDLETALHEQAQAGENRRIGQILESLGYADRETIREALQFQVKEILFHLFRWNQGTYRFEPKPLTFDKEYHIPLPTEFLLMEAIRMVDEWPFIEKKIPSLQIIFAKVLGNEDEAHPFLTEDEEWVYSAVDGERDVEAIIETVQKGEFETCKILVNLLMSGLIREVGTSQKKEVSASAAQDSVIRRILRGGQWILVILGGVVLLGTGFPSDYLGGKELKAVGLEISQSVSIHRMKAVEEKLKVYMLKHNKYPDKIEILVSEKWVSSAEIKDGYGVPFHYERNEDGKGYSLTQAAHP